MGLSCLWLLDLCSHEDLLVETFWCNHVRGRMRYAGSGERAVLPPLHRLKKNIEQALAQTFG
jgi:hypothetical protein